MSQLYCDRFLFENTPLPYAYDALEPYIDTDTMAVHRDRHLQTYIDNLNDLLRAHPALQKRTLEQLILTANQLPNPLGAQLRLNAGGVFNHRFFFSGMRAPAYPQPAGRLLRAIDRSYGSLKKFRSEFLAAALALSGSGYVWLVADGSGGLRIVTTANQDTPLGANLNPILNLDLWEHAYYLKHLNLRSDYVNDWFQVINWTRAERNYLRRGGRC